ncbi:MAG: nucleoside triphosphate pyrophosphohydrolase [Atopobium sp.]|nr:nucleoside triphosphate pyrophosphohydrolase [Atopobium sp.]MBF0922164.1 nucleoside triphosphate pyrophosphohydrolase [Atopobium sp.]
MTSDEKIAQLAAAVDEETKARLGAPQTHPEFDRLIRTIWRLRQEDGCPWDKEQTHQSISKNMIEEAYEAVEAIAEDSPEHLEEELGDVLEQVLLHSQIESDSGASGGSGARNRAVSFDIDDVCRALNQKLVRRHPHVFGPEAGSTSSAAAVLDVWESVKAEERASAEDTVHTEGLLDSVPQSLPALMQAQKISKRAAKMGFEWASINDVWDKVAEERAEFDAEASGTRQKTDEFGDILFALINVARWEGVDAEEALMSACRKFRARWSYMEKAAAERGFSLDEKPELQEDLWQEAKHHLDA